MQRSRTNLEGNTPQLEEKEDQKLRMNLTVYVLKSSATGGHMWSYKGDDQERRDSHLVSKLVCFSADPYDLKILRYLEIRLPILDNGAILDIWVNLHVWE